MFIKPYGLQQAFLCTYLKLYMLNRVRQIQIDYHSKNPCAEIALPVKLDSFIYGKEIVKWVGEPGMTTMGALDQVRYRDACHREYKSGELINRSIFSLHESNPKIQ